MRRVTLVAAVVVLLASPAGAQQMRVFVVDRLDDATSEIASAMSEHRECAGLLLSADISRSHFVVELGPHKGTGFFGNSFGPGVGVTVFDSEGDVRSLLSH